MPTLVAACFLALFNLPFLQAAPDAAPPDTSDTSPSLHFKFDPGSLWSATPGFGLGVGLEVRHLLLPESSLLLMVEPAQHRGIYLASYTTADPFTAPWYGFLQGYYETTGRRWFYGLGADAARASRIAVEKDLYEVEGRVGLYPVPPRLLVQPDVRFIRHRSFGFTEKEAGNYALLSERSKENLSQITTGEFDDFSVLTYGLGVAYDRRNRLARPTRGFLLQATAHRATDLDDLNITYNRFSLSAFGFLPLSSRIDRVLALRAIALLTDNQGEPLPFFLLPVLEGKLTPGIPRERFHGQNFLAFSAELRQPLFQVRDLLGLELVFLGNLASVYDDLFEQFSPRISFEKQPDATGSLPLRPTAGIGIRIVSLFQDKVWLHAILARSPEGLGLTTFRFVHDLRRPRPYIR